MAAYTYPASARINSTTLSEASLNADRPPLWLVLQVNVGDSGDGVLCPIGTLWFRVL